MNENSLLPSPALGPGAGDGTSWGRGTEDLALVSDAVTGVLPSVDSSSPSGYPDRAQLDRTRGPLSTERGHDQAARELADRLAALREIGPYPAPVIRSRPATARELPANAAAIVRDARNPWTVHARYALGAVPYSWNHRAAGYMLADSIAVRIAHPDGRRAVGTWIRNSIAVRKHEHVLAWKWYEGWRWRVGEHGSFPQPCGARALKTAVADPTWRTAPYRLEEVA